MNPIERMRHVADLLISQRRYRESYTIYDELYRQMWSLFGTVQSNLTTVAVPAVGAFSTADRSVWNYGADSAANLLCARMYGVSLTLALDEFTNIVNGHLQCISASVELSREHVRDAVISEFLVLYLLALQPARLKRITPVFGAVTASVDRDHRLRRIRSNHARSSVERQIIDHARKASGTAWRSINALLLEYLDTNGDHTSELARTMASLAGPFSSRSRSRRHSGGQDGYSDRQQSRASNDQRRASESRLFDPATASDEEKRLHYGGMFGLAGKVTKTEIRTRYVHSVSLYHPDKVQHLGPEIKDLAERKTKELNAAYDWLKEKYAI